jgi:hypothetical protein
MNEKKEMAKAYILDRGEYDKRKDEVKPDTPDILPPFPENLPKNRLGLAQWLLLQEHPLTSRVTVNRFWQEVFGTGLVRSSGDFGITGELPSHPGTARLARDRVHRERLGREEALQADRHRARPIGRVPPRRRRSSPRTTPIACSPADRVSGWMPRWSATTRSPPAACS